MQRRSLLIGGFLVISGGASWALTQVAGSVPDNLTRAAPSGQALSADKSTLLVDIRRPEEWRQSGVIEGALLVTYTDAESFLRTVAPHLKPGQSLSVICRSGSRSARASRQLSEITETRIVDVQGGMNRILAEGYKPVAPTRAMGCAAC